MGRLPPRKPGPGGHGPAPFDRATLMGAKLFTRIAVRGVAVRAGVVLIAVVLAGSLRSSTQALPTDDIGDLVFGQPDLVTGSCNTGGLSVSSLCRPQWMAFDGDGDLYVVDAVNSRVLVYDDAATGGDTVADLVIGQPNFTTSGCPAPTATSLCFAAGVAIDSAGNVFVSDWGNNRVLAYITPQSTDVIADGVIGQPNLWGAQRDDDLQSVRDRDRLGR